MNELSDLYSSPNIVQVIKVRRMRWAGHADHIGKRGGIYRVLGGKPKGKRPLGRPRQGWEDNIKIFRKMDVMVGSTWLRIGTGGGHL